ncbi:methylglyoxal synthase [Porphyromonadaceae bacterium NLAE-zl-C104]|jgi:methylglyoxal synthase|uniref:methylglyoxal synthase n=1 Tax=Proteiniphilum TaxID=294702 RepID=UPI0008EC1916|nr:MULTISPECIES: methylglyoxal synthase [Proteiniphilum]MDY9918995.1 methylglyoxal synthase [Proteiniphilum sp.]SFS58462.1 methylglyoxal synthase [Porphyromonadaceae bacterium NLAE-zl-C104]
MKRKLTIALVAHDHRKADMVEWVVFNADFLSKHHLVCTGTTGTLVRDALYEKGVYPEFTIMNSGPMGGDAEIAAMVVRKEIDLAVFLIDDLNPQPHEADIMMLLRQCRVHNVPIACNRYSADLMITSNLWDDDDYTPSPPRYEKFDRESLNL